jgi:hypothetical protein
MGFGDDSTPRALVARGRAGWLRARRRRQHGDPARGAAVGFVAAFFAGGVEIAALADGSGKTWWPVGCRTRWNRWPAAMASGLISGV